MNTLIRCNGIATHWYPTSVEEYRNNLILDMTVPNAVALRSNIVYNLQYLEFLEKELTELHLSSVLTCMLVKTYVITGMAILEGVFSNIIHSIGRWNTSHFRSLGSTISNDTNFSGTMYTVKTEILQVVPDFEIQMDMDSFIKILKNRHDVLGVDHLVYPSLIRLIYSSL